MSTILQEADKIAGEDRSRDYGHPLENHQRIADFWNTYLGCVCIEPQDVAMMMILLKVAREMNCHKRDNLTDIAGYVKCADMMNEKVDERVKYVQENWTNPKMDSVSTKPSAPEIRPGQVWKSIMFGDSVTVAGVSDGYVAAIRDDGLQSSMSEDLFRDYHTLSLGPSEFVEKEQPKKEAEIKVGQIWMSKHTGSGWLVAGVYDSCIILKHKAIEIHEWKDQLLENYVLCDKATEATAPPSYYYLASPYTSYALGTGLNKLNIASATAAAQTRLLMEAGISAFSPVIHSHYVAPEGTHADHDFWLKVDEAYLSRAKGLIVCKLPGWDVSKGIAAEIEMAKKYGLPIYYMEPGVVPISVEKNL